MARGSLASYVVDEILGNNNVSQILSDDLIICATTDNISFCLRSDCLNLTKKCVSCCIAKFSDMHQSQEKSKVLALVVQGELLVCSCAQNFARDWCVSEIFCNFESAIPGHAASDGIVSPDAHSHNCWHIIYKLYLQEIFAFSGLQKHFTCFLWVYVCPTCL